MAGPETTTGVPMPDALKHGLLIDGPFGAFTVVVATPIECPECHVARSVFVLRRCELGPWIYRCAMACDR